jgi:hypothetical protein
MYTQTNDYCDLGKQTLLLVREGAPHRQGNKFQTQTHEKETISGQTSSQWLDTKTYWLTLSRSDSDSTSDLSSERAPHWDRTTNSRPWNLKRSNIWSNVRKVVSSPRHTDWLTVSRKLTLTLTSRQRGRPTEEGQQIPDPNSWKRNNVWSNVHKVGSTPRHTDWLTDWLWAVKSLWLWQIMDATFCKRGRPTETGQQTPYPNSWKGRNIWSNVHKVGSTPRHTDWLTVSRKVTLTLALTDLATCWRWMVSFTRWPLYLPWRIPRNPSKVVSVPNQSGRELVKIIDRTMTPTQTPGSPVRRYNWVSVALRTVTVQIILAYGLLFCSNSVFWAVSWM